MNNLDSLTLKYFYFENFNFIKGAIIQKIQLPSRYEVILTLRNLQEEKPQNKKLYININPKYPHICFIDEKTSYLRNIEIPQKPPMFCMQLRKYLSGSKIKDFKIIKYERILELYFDYFDEIGSMTRLCLALEFMGKHSNIILYNSSTKTIIGSIHNISSDKSSIREIYGGISYIYPPLKNKLDVLNISYSTFYEIAKNKNIKEISDNFYYFNQSLIEKILSEFDDLNEVFSKMQKLQNIQEFDYIFDYWNGKNSVAFCIDDYFSKIMFEEILSNKKSKLKKYLQKDLKKLSTTINHTFDNSKMQKYKLFADLIMAYMYNIQPNQKEIDIEGYKIELDEKLSVAENAQKYYSLYKKTKAGYEYSNERAKKAKEKLEYLESIIFNIENSCDFDELNEIEDELSVLGYLEIKKHNKELKITKEIFKGWEIYLGKNNKQNDFLISKIAKSDDIWFHGLNFPSSHVILKVPNNKQKPSKEVLEYCAKLVKENSKAKYSGKTSIIMTERKNLKKPPNTYLGYVTYKNELEIVI